jgi:hypothetical protein
MPQEIFKNIRRNWKENRRLQLLAHTEIVNLLGENVPVAKRKTERLLISRKEAGRGENSEKSIYTVVLSGRNWGHFLHMKIFQRSDLKNFSKLKYVRNAPTNENYIQEDVKFLLFSRQACQCWNQNWPPVCYCKIQNRIMNSVAWFQASVAK